MPRSAELNILGKKRTFDKNLKWELEGVGRLKRLSCLQEQAEVWGRKDITWKMSNIIKMIFPSLGKVKIRKQTIRW